MRIDGTWTALVTPFASWGDVDLEGLKKNVEFQISQGITGVVPMGTTGELPTIIKREHISVIGNVARFCKKQCGVMAGTGSNSTAEAFEYTRHAVEAGCDAVLLVDCYYNGPSSQELRDEYYAAIAQEFSDMMIVPYVIPGRSGTELSVPDLAILHDKYPNISAVKEATSNLDRMGYTRELLGANFGIMSGDDGLTFQMMTDSRILADGVISVISNIAPAAVKNLVLKMSENIAEARAIAQALEPLLELVTVKMMNPRIMPNGEVVEVEDRYRNPLPIKTMMAGLGMPSGGCRQPLGRMSKAGVELIREALSDVWKHNSWILRPIESFYEVDIEARLNDDSIWWALAAK